MNGKSSKSSHKYEVTFEGGILGIRRRPQPKSKPNTATAKRTLKRVRQWNRCISYFKSRCVYCMKTYDVLTKDHFIPISKGGSKSGGCNLVPACSSCNHAKDDHHPNDWCNEEQLERIHTYFWDLRIEHYSRMDY